MEAENAKDFIDSINYAIFFMGAAEDDNFNETETRKHLFKLRELVEKLNEEKIILNNES
jgi:hypothetical protein